MNRRLPEGTRAETEDVEDSLDGVEDGEAMVAVIVQRRAKEEVLFRMTVLRRWKARVLALASKTRETHRA
jgi:hypothetical protein